ncbi:hypothetical protein GYMLUDRAFT_165046 [Collybiopsis luxurians FD-317 M1]|uniref:Integrase core domain-containing protein n=1 Tax=Collybiopsis luxurians FD-317 M1 TaxID=944289 RepID=A0A0D0CHP9_9AGAR|nr:hypothetical protein GYMLUDRAFT_165046 [Collybiopsis luxurians FD-317 M1]
MVHQSLWHIITCTILLALSIAAQPAPDEALQVHTIWTAYAELGICATQAIQLQLGDLSQIQQQQASAHDFLDLVGGHQFLFSPEEYNTIYTSIQSMLTALNEAAQHSEDIVEHDPIAPVHISRTRRHRQPQKEINRELLETSLQLHSPTHIAPIFDCSAWTIWRRALEHGLVEPCPPVYIAYEHPETHEFLRLYQSSTQPMSTLSDEELDVIVHHILEVSPAFGQRMITGHLHHLGHRVPLERVWASYEWRFEVQGLAKRPGSWTKLNRGHTADTVLSLFLQAIEEHHTPSQVCTLFLILQQYGNRSIHNAQIERFWCDVTQGFGVKWYNFFSDLELDAGLCSNDGCHIWLLHQFFLPSINEDALEQAKAWNYHTMHFDGSEWDRSPCDMFFFGVLQESLRGPEDVANVAGTFVQS